MDFLKLAEIRYSVRSYLDKPVENEKMEMVLEAARLAPSACNFQPIVLIVIQNEISRKKLISVYNRPWFLSAPVIIAACCDHSVSWHRADGKDFGDIDIAIALDHMTLAATELGLGTCWVGAFKQPEAKDLLKLPDNIDPVAFTPLGYPSSTDYVPKNRKDVCDFVYWNQYGNRERS